MTRIQSVAKKIRERFPVSFAGDTLITSGESFYITYTSFNGGSLNIRAIWSGSYDVQILAEVLACEFNLKVGYAENINNEATRYTLLAL